MQPPHFDNWKDAWEFHAGEQAKVYEQLNADALLEILRKDGPDPYYSIWYVLKRKGDDKTGKALVGILAGYTGADQFLLRHHCIETIFTLLKLRGDALKTLISGPSTGFHIDYFELGLSILRNKISSREKG